jgi:hypothetical protein
MNYMPRISYLRAKIIAAQRLVKRRLNLGVILRISSVDVIVSVDQDR